MYIIGFTRSCPVLAPTVCRSSSGAPSNGPPTLPWLARNSSMILLFQSDISGTLILFRSTCAGLAARLAANAMRHTSTGASHGFIPAAEGTPGAGPPEVLGLRAGLPAGAGGLRAGVGRDYP